MAGSNTDCLQYLSMIPGSVGLTSKSSKSLAPGCTVSAIPAEADRLLQIWAWYISQEGGQLTLGYPKRSAMICSGGASAEAEELENAADKRVGAVADTIIDDMGRRGLQRQVMAIWNHYRSAVARYRGDPHQMLIDGCVTFLIEAKRRGIAQ